MENAQQLDGHFSWLEIGWCVWRACSRAILCDGASQRKAVFIMQTRLISNKNTQKVKQPLDGAEREKREEAIFNK